VLVLDAIILPIFLVLHVEVMGNLILAEYNVP
jgi:hypothetical protein